MATSKPMRVFAVVAALLFLVTSVGFSGMVLYSMWKDSQTKQTASTETKQSSDDTKDNKEGKKLQGTKLQDFTPVAKVEKLEVQDIQVGTGEEAKAGATVTAHYTGALAKDGTIFQSSHDMDGDKPIEFPLDGVIKGWTDGVPGMKVGGKRRLLIPADQAYGPQERPGIPANSDLVFDIELAAVKNQ